MKVTMEIIEPKGFFSKKWALNARVEFSEEEKQIIKHSGLDKYSFFEPQRSADDDEQYTVGNLLHNGGGQFFYSDRAACNGHEERFKEALVQLKEAITQNGAPTGAKTFEL